MSTIQLSDSFITRTRALLGDDSPAFEAALQADPPVSIRLHAQKATETLLEAPVPWSSRGYYLPERLTFTFDPLFHAGVYYVQEASSMFLEQAVRQYVDEPAVCLDLCAAPGGKSTLLLDTLPEGSLLVSNEVIRSRAGILAGNLARWGNPNVVVTSSDPEKFGALSEQFDVIVTDVPCSGEGMFRKDPASIGEWSESNVKLCAARQRRIIESVADALKPGGLLIYSTCTYNIEEDEENIRYICELLDGEVLPLSTQSEWSITGALKYDDPVYRFLPHRTRGEGFFLAVICKGENSKTKKIKQKERQQRDTLNKKLPKEWLLNPDQYYWTTENNRISAYPMQHSELIRALKQQLNILIAGIEIGEIKGKDLIPSPTLPFSTAFNPTAFPTYELTLGEALQYLRRDPILLPNTSPKGYQAVTYKGHPLGLLKNLGNRTNNLYPQAWKIRNAENPAEIKVLEW